MAPQVGHFLLEAGHSRSVTAAHMLDHDLAAPLFADRHVTTGSVSIVAPIVAMTMAPIVRPIIIATFTITPAAARWFVSTSHLPSPIRITSTVLILCPIRGACAWPRRNSACWLDDAHGAAPACGGRR